MERRLKDSKLLMDDMRKKGLYNSNEKGKIISDPDIIIEECKSSLKHLCTTITLHYLNSRDNNKVFHIIHKRVCTLHNKLFLITLFKDLHSTSHIV